MIAGRGELHVVEQNCTWLIHTRRLAGKFRMSKGRFLYLCQEHTISRPDTQMRKALSCKMRVAITLWRLGTNDSYRPIGYLFSVSRSSVCPFVKEMRQAIISKLLPTYIRIPEGDALKEVVKANITFHNALVLLMVVTSQL